MQSVMQLGTNKPHLQIEQMKFKQHPVLVKQEITPNLHMTH